MALLLSGACIATTRFLTNLRTPDGTHPMVVRIGIVGAQTMAMARRPLGQRDSVKTSSPSKPVVCTMARHSMLCTPRYNTLQRQGTPHSTPPHLNTQRAQVGRQPVGQHKEAPARHRVRPAQHRDLHPRPARDRSACTRRKGPATTRGRGCVCGGTLSWRPWVRRICGRCSADLAALRARLRTHRGPIHTRSICRWCLCLCCARYMCSSRGCPLLHSSQKWRLCRCGICRGQQGASLVACHVFVAPLQALL